MRLGAHVSAMRGRLLAAGVGLAAAAVPHAAAARHDPSRALEAPGDTMAVVALTGLGIAALFAAASVAYLYRRQRGLRWDYQLAEGTLSEGEGETADHDSH